MDMNIITATLTLYSGLLNEIRARCETIRSLPDNGTLGSVTRYELCFLQFRMICELIALGCLVAHGDIIETKSVRLRRAYEADWILKQLTKLHADFFPVPGQTIDFEAKKGLRFIPFDGDSLTKSDLIKLYARTGSVLHRGTIENLAPLATKVNFPEVISWERKISNLLNYHHIELKSDPNRQIWAALYGPSGGASATLMTRE
jgi:hypothetical protein